MGRGKPHHWPHRMPGLFKQQDTSLQEYLLVLLLKRNFILPSTFISLQNSLSSHMPGHEEKILSKLDKLRAFLELIIRWKRRPIIRYLHKGVPAQCGNCCEETQEQREPIKGGGRLEGE